MHAWGQVGTLEQHGGMQTACCLCTDPPHMGSGSSGTRDLRVWSMTGNTNADLWKGISPACVPSPGPCQVPCWGRLGLMGHMFLPHMPMCAGHSPEVGQTREDEGGVEAVGHPCTYSTHSPHLPSIFCPHLLPQHSTVLSKKKPVPKSLQGAKPPQPPTDS